MDLVKLPLGDGEELAGIAVEVVDGGRRGRARDRAALQLEVLLDLVRAHAVDQRKGLCVCVRARLCV